MKTLKKMGFASLASVSLVVVAPYTLAETQERSASSSTVHRVSHALANSQQYTNGAASGYKWGEHSQSKRSQSTWAGSTSNQSGYKWGEKNGLNRSTATTEQTGKRWGRGNFSEQTGKRWGRGSFSEQSGKRWGRGSFSEQSGKRWGRGSFSEQSGKRWGRG